MFWSFIVTDEADVTVGPLIVLGNANDQTVEGWTSSAQTSMALGLGLVTMAFLTLAAFVLGVTRKCHSTSYLVSLPQ